MDKVYKKLLDYSFFLLGKRRYTSAGLEKKIRFFIKGKKEKFEDVEDMDLIIFKVLDRLKELKYLNDNQFVQDYISERINFRPRGQFLIKKELILKGISVQLFNEVFQKMDINEAEVAEKCLKKRAKKWEKLTFQDKKNKAFTYLNSRGFPLEAIYKAIQCCYNQCEG